MIPTQVDVAIMGNEKRHLNTCLMIALHQQCETNCAGHSTFVALASRPVACI